MYVHVMTNYFCNYNCEYCYLGDLKKSNSVINLDKLKAQLEELAARYDIDEIHCYGGEITLLDEDFIVKVLETCKPYAYTSWVTNMSSPAKVDRIVNKTGVSYATSLNDERPHHEELLGKVYMMENRPNSIIQVATPSLLKKSPQEVLSEVEKYKPQYLGIVQYFPSITNSCCNYSDANCTPNKDFCDFMQSIIEEHSGGEYSFLLENVHALNQVICGDYTPWTNNAIFITPLNEYACVLYDPTDYGREHFHNVKNLDIFDFINTKEVERYKIKCGNCSMFGHCYAEHMRNWNPYDECCGNKSLVEWYKEFTK